MHRTEGSNHLAHMFTDGPPGTRVEENWLNAIQEELAYVIEQAGLALKTASTETHQQLRQAIALMITGAGELPTGVKMLFYQDTAPTGWTIQNTLDDKLVFVTKGSAAGGQVGGAVHSTGSWTISGLSGPSHVHDINEEHELDGNTLGAGANNGHDVPDYGNQAQPWLTASGGTGAVTANGAWRPAAYSFIVCSKN